jgi:hypothetical protein
MYVGSNYEGRASLLSREEQMIVVIVMIIEGHFSGEMVIRMITIIINIKTK